MIMQATQREIAQYVLNFLLNEFDGTNALPTLTVVKPTTTAPPTNAGTQPAPGSGQPGGQPATEPDAISGGQTEDEPPSAGGETWSELLDGGGAFCAPLNAQLIDDTRKIGNCD
jgi:hypothetical protein